MDAESNITRKTPNERNEDMNPIKDVGPIGEDVKKNGELMYIFVIIIEVCTYIGFF